MNNTILAIETSSNICGISLIKNGALIDSIDKKKSKQHAEVLPKLYQDLKIKTNFSLSNIDALAVSIGPGSFTGLRIGLSFTKGLAFSKNLPIIPISTMMALAYNARKFLPTLGIIHSHAKRVFYQKIRWSNVVPYSDGDIKVAEWDKFLNEIDQTENIFQLNCEKLDESSGFISTSLSSSSIGILANINYNELVIDQPYDLVPNYVSPFIIKKINDFKKSRN
tara:strand:+ start:340 stop:1008 length:669 start_codon:yes stop_codon:yes gene_type:complete